MGRHKNNAGHQNPASPEAAPEGAAAVDPVDDTNSATITGNGEGTPLPAISGEAVTNVAGGNGTDVPDAPVGDPVDPAVTETVDPTAEGTGEENTLPEISTGSGVDPAISTGDTVPAAPEGAAAVEGKTEEKPEENPETGGGKGNVRIKSRPGKRIFLPGGKIAEFDADGFLEVEEITAKYLLSIPGYKEG